MTTLHTVGSVALILWVTVTLLNWLGLDYRWWKNKLGKPSREKEEQEQ